MDREETGALAERLLALLGTGGSAEPTLGAGMDLAEAYRVGAEVTRLRRLRGEQPVGRKIGFTNSTIWPIYGVAAPMWAHVYDTTVHDLAALAGRFSLAGLSEPRIEPEIIFGLSAAPRADMDEAALLDCVGWVAHGFEIVQSVWPGWRLTLPQTAAAFGLHGALLVGRRVSVDDPQHWLRMLGNFSVTLTRDDDPVAVGQASFVLGGPLSALRFLVETLANDPAAAPLAAGEIVTTGTLTDAQPAIPGHRWTTVLDGIALDGCDLQFV